MHDSVLSRTDTILVVVDVQEPFTKNVFERDRVVSNVIKLVEAANVLGVPVVTTLQNEARMGDVVPEVLEVLQDDERIDKMTFSCCGVKPFVRRMEGMGRYSALLCGVETHVCVNQTAHDLLVLGYKVHVAEDAVSSRRESDWRIGLAKMRASGVVIDSTEMAIFELLGDAAAAEFKSILQIVK